MFLQLSYAANATIGFTLGFLLLLTNDQGERTPIATRYRLVKRSLAILGLLGATFDVIILLFLTPQSPFSDFNGKDGMSYLILENFALPFVLYYIILLIVTTLWRTIHIESSKMRILTIHYALGGLPLLAYIVGYLGHTDTSSSNLYFSTPYATVVGNVMRIGMIYLLIVIGGYTIWRVVRFNNEARKHIANTRLKQSHSFKRIALYALLYFLLVIGDNIITTVQYDIFMLYAGAVLYFLMATESINGYYTFKIYEEVMAATALNEAEARLMARDRLFSQKLEQWVADKRYTDNTATVETIASELGVSYGYMTNYFRTVVRVPFRTWRISHRLEEAKRLIVTRPELSFMEIARLVGYNNRSNFYRHFRDYEGCSPEEYKLLTPSDN